MKRRIISPRNFIGIKLPHAAKHSWPCRSNCPCYRHCLMHPKINHINSNYIKFSPVINVPSGLIQSYIFFRTEEQHEAMEAALYNLNRADFDLCQEEDADCPELCWASSKTWPKAVWFVVCLIDQSERFQRREGKPPVPSTMAYLSWAQLHCVSAGDRTFWCATDVMWWAVRACVPVCVLTWIQLKKAKHVNVCVCVCVLKNACRQRQGYLWGELREDEMEGASDDAAFLKIAHRPRSFCPRCFLFLAFPPSLLSIFWLPPSFKNQNSA